jgi:DNA-binding MarR family transcriptional regulator
MSGGGDVKRSQLAARVSGALKIDQDTANAQVDALCDSGLLAASDEATRITLTERGADLHARVRSAVASITEMLWGDIPTDDLTTAARVLNIVRERANVELEPR